MIRTLAMMVLTWGYILLGIYVCKYCRRIKPISSTFLGDLDTNGKWPLGVVVWKHRLRKEWPTAALLGVWMRVANAIE